MSFPAFFFLFPLVIVPIIIHLLSRRKLKKIDFPTLIFIIKNEIKIIRWLRLKSLFLLILRITILISLILAAANLRIPFGFPEQSEPLIVDKSPSMENFRTEEKKTLIVPLYSGIPQFSPYLKKHATGILITDAQKNGFTQILKKREKFPGIRIKKKDFPEGNLGIISARSGPSFEAEKTNIIFSIINEYKEEKKTRLTLKSDGKTIKEENRIFNEGETESNFEITLKRGSHQVSLELEDEKGFDFDNRYYFVLNTLERKKICILSDNYPERLIAALSVSHFEPKWVKKVTEIKGNLFIASDFEKEELLSLLRNPVPGIICLDGEENTLISNKIPDRISTIVGESFLTGSYNLKFLNEIPINYCCFITSGEALIYFKNGNPFVSKIEKHLILPISLEKNDLSLHPVFIPLLFYLINSLSDEIFYDNILLDEPIIIKSSFLPKIINPEGKENQMDAIKENVFLSKETKKCGIYRITDGKATRGLIAANTPTSESKLESLSEEELQYIFGKSSLSNGASFFLFVAFLCFVLSVFIEKRS
jgi:hypothetical protein